MKDLIEELDELGYTVLIRKKMNKEQITVIEIFSNTVTKSEAIKNNAIKIYFLRHSSKSFEWLTRKILNYYINIILKQKNPFSFHLIDLVNGLCSRAYSKFCRNYNKKDYPEMIAIAAVVIIVLLSTISRIHYRIKFRNMFF